MMKSANTTTGSDAERGSSAPAPASATPSNDLQDFKAFLQLRERAAKAYINGDAGPLHELTASASPATFFGPDGGHCSGARDVWATYERGARSFARGGDDRLEILHVGASEGVAYWTGFQHATVHMRGKDDPVEFHLRVTETFRRENGGWKLVHRHADALKADETS